MWKFTFDILLRCRCSVKVENAKIAEIPKLVPKIIVRYSATFEVYATLGYISIEPLKVIEQCYLVFQLQSSVQKTNELLYYSSDIHQYNTRAAFQIYRYQDLASNAAESPINTAVGTFHLFLRELRMTTIYIFSLKEHYKK